MLLRIVFENIENIILVLYGNCLCYLNLVFFFVICVFQEKKKGKQMFVFVFLALLIFQNKNQFKKCKQTNLKIVFFLCFQKPLSITVFKNNNQTDP